LADATLDLILGKCSRLHQHLTQTAAGLGLLVEGLPQLDLIDQLRTQKFLA
jgi:hypothetical protein